MSRKNGRETVMSRHHFCARKAAKSISESPSARIVGEAEAIVRQTWMALLRERSEEMQAAWGRALTRYAVAEQELAAAWRSGDPRSVAAAQERVDRARKACVKARLAVGQVFTALMIEERKADASPETGGLRSTRRRD